MTDAGYDIDIDIGIGAGLEAPTLQQPQQVIEVIGAQGWCQA